MLVVEVDMVDAETAKRAIAAGANVLRMFPNLVARTTASRQPRMARPTSSSFLNGPYMSAVSRNVTPSLIARSIVAMDSFSSRPA
jgi:hypothetical protein